MEKKFECCNLEFLNWKSYGKHLEKEHAKDTINCTVCGIKKKGWINLRRHFYEYHKSKNTNVQSNIFHELSENPCSNENENTKELNDFNFEIENFVDILDKKRAEFWTKFGQNLMDLKFEFNLSQAAIDRVVYQTKNFVSTVLDELKVNFFYHKLVVFHFPESCLFAVGF